MPLAAGRSSSWLLFAPLLLFVAALKAQTAASSNGVAAGARAHGSWKVVYEEDFEGRAPLVKAGALR